MKRSALILGVAVGIASPAMAAVTSDPWVLWSRDTHFEGSRPAHQWRTDRWMVRGGPFENRGECDRRMGQHLRSAAELLGDEYRVTAKLDAAVVARQRDGAGGVRRRYMCLPASAAPPK